MEGWFLVAMNGLALGLASTLHCAGMCGAISCSLLMAQSADTRSMRSAFAQTHAGRITAYAIPGAAVGAIGAPAIAWLDRDLAFHLLQWAAAASLIWVGLSVAGLVPSIAAVDRGLGALAGSVARLNGTLQRRSGAPFVSGVAWGLMPCAMVYAALFTAMLTGSAVGGAVVMGAFGIGTLPGLVATSFGFGRLMRMSRARPQRLAAGLALAAFGVATVLFVQPHLAYLCLPERTTDARDKKPARTIDPHQSAVAAASLRFAQTRNPELP